MWTYTLASFGTTVGVLLPCAAILFWLREEPDIRAYGRIFLVQFVLGLLLFNIFDIVYVGAALLQVRALLHSGRRARTCRTAEK